MGGIVRIILIAALVAVQALQGFGIIPPFATLPLWERWLTYSFFHGNWFHLAVNCIAIWGLYNPKRPCKPCRDLIIPYIIALVVFPFALRPMIGFSNMLYAVIGIQTPDFKSPWWKSTNVQIFFAVTLVMAFIPRISAFTHILSFAAGVGMAIIRRGIQSLLDDAGPYCQ